MPVGSAFTVEYPWTVEPAEYLTTSVVRYKNVSYPQGWFVDRSNRMIQVRKGLPISIPRGSEVKVQLGPLRNPLSEDLPGLSFILTSYTDTTWEYSIDRVNSSLIPTFKCNFPCATCPSHQQKDTCMSCFKNIANITQKYLNGTKCLN